jgi:hypothetical protein
MAVTLTDGRVEQIDPTPQPLFHANQLAIDHDRSCLLFHLTLFYCFYSAPDAPC